MKISSILSLEKSVTCKTLQVYVMVGILWVVYGGWEGPGRGLDCIMLQHWLEVVRVESLVFDQVLSSTLECLPCNPSGLISRAEQTFQILDPT